MSIPLEDQVADVLLKAQRGLELPDSVLAGRAGVSAAEVRRARAARGGSPEIGPGDAAVLLRIAPLLGLHAGALLALPRYRPEERNVPGLATLASDYGEMRVNAYLLEIGGGAGRALLFDTGTDAAAILGRLRERRLGLGAIFLTHTHGDHIAAAAAVQAQTGAAVFVSSLEPPGALPAGVRALETFEPGREFAFGPLRLETRLTCGHSRGGITYVVRGLAGARDGEEFPLAVVGDALFAGSMGGGLVSYREALRTNREQIFTLPPQTVLCPGHGPLTTVGEERQSNPFFA